MPHPEYPRSNIQLYRGVSDESYALGVVSPVAVTAEALTPGAPPRLTGRCVGKYLVPLTKELDEAAPRPTVAEIPDAVIERLLLKDKASWVDKPGVNDYVLHDLYTSCNLKAIPQQISRQAVFPRSYQYEWECVRSRRRRACDEAERPARVARIKGAARGRLARPPGDGFDCYEPLPFWWFGSGADTDGDDTANKTGNAARNVAAEDAPGRPAPRAPRAPRAPPAYCRDCSDPPAAAPSRFSGAPGGGGGGGGSGAESRRWRDWPDVSAQLTDREIAKLMEEVGRPFRNEACTWYNNNYPSQKYPIIPRKFAR